MISITILIVNVLQSKLTYMVKSNEIQKIIWIILILMLLIIAIEQYFVHEVEIKVFIRFNENNIIGHSKAEVIKEYGEFDRIFIREYEVDGKIAKYAGLYKVSEQVDYFGPNFNTYYWILFSEEDIALSTDLRTPPDEA